MYVYPQSVTAQKTEGFRHFKLVLQYMAHDMTSSGEYQVTHACQVYDSSPYIYNRQQVALLLYSSLFLQRTGLPARSQIDQ